MKIVYFILLVSFLVSDEFSDDFGSDEIIKIEKTEKEDRKLEIDSDISLSSSYNNKHEKPINQILNDFRGFSALDVSINTNIQYKINENFKIKANVKANNDFIYQIKSKEYKTIPKGYENEIDVNELYIQGKISDNVDITLGRQIVPWGKMDAIRVLDVLNNTDNRKPGLIDIKDLKLGRSMSKIDYFVYDWSLSAIILHENRFSKIPQYGSDYAKPKPTHSKTPSDDQGIALSISRSLKGQDIGLYYVKQHMDNQNHYSDMVGFSYVVVVKGILFKTDVAYLGDGAMDIAGGIEYSGFKNKVITIEIASKQDNIHYFARITKEFFNKSLKWNKSIYAVNDVNNMTMKTNLDYDINDELSASLGYILYKGDKNQFKLMNNNNRFFGTIKYSF